MYLQGNLQNVFDALYDIGVIDPVLKKNWGQSLRELPRHFHEFHQALDVANHYQNDVALMTSKLRQFNGQVLEFLAMEVAREFADFHKRQQLH